MLEVGTIIKVPPDINDIGFIKIIGSQKAKPDPLNVKFGFISDYLIQSYDNRLQQYIGEAFNATQKEIDEWLQYEKDFGTNAELIKKCP